MDHRAIFIKHVIPCTTICSYRQQLGRKPCWIILMPRVMCLIWRLLNSTLWGSNLNICAISLYIYYNTSFLMKKLQWSWKLDFSKDQISFLHIICINTAYYDLFLIRTAEASRTSEAILIFYWILGINIFLILRHDLFIELASVDCFHPFESTYGRVLNTFLKQSQSQFASKRILKLLIPCTEGPNP